MRRVLADLAVYAAIVLGYFACMHALSGLTFRTVNNWTEEGRFRHPSDGHSPFPFPVVVVDRNSNGRFYASIVQFESIGKHRRSHPTSTFLIPEGKEAELNQQVATQSWYDDRLAPGRFEVKQLPKGRQSLKVVSSYDASDRGRHTFVSWYEASAQDIKPRYYSWNRDWNTYAKFILPGMIPYTIIWCFGARRLLRWRRQRQLAGRAAENS